MNIMQAIIESGFLKSFFLLFVTFIGALITEMLSLYTGTQGVKPFLRKVLPGKSKHWYVVANALLLPIIGTILSFIILEPDSVKSSLCAGLTWCGTLQSLGFSIAAKKS